MVSVTWLAEDYAVAPQLQEADLAEVLALGFRAIVNNRPDLEAPDQPLAEKIEAQARRLGLDYLHLPVITGTLDEAQARQLTRFMRETGGPVLGFCRSGHRSSMLWQLSRRIEEDEDD
ncbi:MAG: TIGR01244 family sulfur transferase [Sphingosinicella sp.]